MNCSVFKRAARRGLVLVVLPLAISGCGIFDSKRVDYKSVQRNKPLDVPPELSTPGKDERYSVSDLGSKGTTYSNYLAERTGRKTGDGEVIPLLPQYENIRIERAGTQRWLVLPETPEKIWPLLKQFVEIRGLKVNLESVETGIIETDWAEKNVGVTLGGIRGVLSRAMGTLYDTSERDKYRFRLEPGLNEGTTEVFLSHRGAEEVFIDEGRSDTRWQPRSVDPEREAEMLLRLMSFVGLEEKKAQAMLTAEVPDAGRVRVLEKDGVLALEVEERFDRAWRRVGLVLDRNGFTVEDRDRKAGEYFVRYDDPVADKTKVESSFWASLAFWRDKDALVAVDSSFRIVVKANGEEQTRVNVADKAGAELNTAAARRILELMQGELK